MKSPATTVTAFLASLPEDRRKAIEAARLIVRKHLPKGYVESLSGSGWIAWSVPLEVYPDTYNGHPLMYVGLVNQKSHISLHLVCAYMNPVLQAKLASGFKTAGKKLDMGKGCLRFTKFEELALAPIAEVVAAVPMDKYIAIAKQAHSPEARRARSAERAKSATGAKAVKSGKAAKAAKPVKATKPVKSAKAATSKKRAKKK